MKAWENNIRKMVPYVAGEQPDFPDMIKLNTNENPYPPAPNVEKALKLEEIERLRLYPDANATPLAQALADFYHVNQNQIFIGVGSDDVLAMSFLTFFNSNRPILFPDITYSFYDVWANLYKIPYHQPKLDEDFRIKKEDYLVPNGGIVLANPNAPTSIYEDISIIEEIVKANQDVIVIVDEAYIDFGGKSMIPLVNQYDNLVVVHTFSKSRSLAGLRVGVAIANPVLIQALDTIKNSYNSYTMNRLSIMLGVESVTDVDYFQCVCSKIISTRDYVRDELLKLGFKIPESKTNFLFITHPKLSAEDLFQSLKSAHIFVRYWNKDRISEYLRVSIGTEEEMETFLTFVKKYCEEKGILANS